MGSVLGVPVVGEMAVVKSKCETHRVTKGRFTMVCVRVALAFLVAFLMLTPTTLVLFMAFLVLAGVTLVLLAMLLMLACVALVALTVLAVVRIMPQVSARCVGPKVCEKRGHRRYGAVGEGRRAT